MNAPCLRPLLTASGLLLAAGFGPLTSPAQSSLPYFVSPNQAPVFSPANTKTSDTPALISRYGLGLLFNATQLAPGTKALDEKIAGAFGLGENTAVLPLGPVPAGSAAGNPGHYFAVSRISERKEVVIFHVLADGSTEAFLCDFTGRLRGAVVIAADGTVRRVGFWRAVGKFKAELSVIGQEVRANSRRYENFILAGT